MKPESGRTETKVKSPCVSICALDEHDVCIGCHRTGEEITHWGKMTNEERQAVMGRVAEREKRAIL